MKLLRFMVRFFRTTRVNLINAIGKLYLRYKGVQYGKGLRLYGIPRVSIAKGAKIILGDNVTIVSSYSENLVGLSWKTILCSARPGSILKIGNNSGLSGAVLYAMEAIYIGDFVNIGRNVSIYDTDFHPLDAQDRRKHIETRIHTAPVYIGNDAFVGAYAIILKGVNIGKRAIVGAGSVVAEDVAEDTVVAGNPAQKIKGL